MAGPPMDEYAEETTKSKFWRKMEEAPFVPISIAGLMGAVAYKIYQYRNRGSMSTSIYLMHTRVQAQSVAVGGLTLGVTYYILRDLWNKRKSNQLTGSTNTGDQK